MTDGCPSRRQLLASLGTASVAGLAGCTGNVFGDRSESCPEYAPAETSTTAWRGKFGPPTNTGMVRADATPEDDLTLDWEAAVPTYVGHHVPVVAEGTVYAHDSDSVVSALDAATGETLWEVAITDPSGAPAVSGDTLVVATWNGVWAVETETGDTQWRRWDFDGDPFDAPPVVANDTVYLQRGIATYALSLADGTTRWRVPTGLPSTAEPAVTADTVFVAGDDTYVRALSADDGSEHWRKKTDARIDCNLSVVDETLVAGTGAGTILAVDTATGAERWRHELAPTGLGNTEAAAPPEVIATDGSRVYVATETQLLAFAITDGTRCWRDLSYEYAYASGVAVGGGKVYAPTTGSGAHVTVFDAASGDRLQTLTDDRFDHLNIGPSLAEGGIYLAGRHEVVRLD